MARKTGMNQNALVCREMTPADLASAIELCRTAGWNQLDRDWEQFLALNPKSSCVAIIEDRVVGTVTTVGYEDRFGWIGMMLVEPALRRQGIGTRLMNEAFQLLADQSTIRLDATPNGREVYRKLDFVDEYGLSRMQTVVSANISSDMNHSARPMAWDDLPMVFEIDNVTFGADRRALLAWVFECTPGYAWVVEENKRVAGYCFGRHGFNFEQIGPVVAENDRIASQLVSACLSGQTGRPFVIDVPHRHITWLRWLESIGFKEQRSFMRMYRGENR